jgi:hypothetical protein
MRSCIELFRDGTPVCPEIQINILLLCVLSWDFSGSRCELVAHQTVVHGRPESVRAQETKELHMRINTFTLSHLGVDLAFELGWDFAHYGLTPTDDALVGWPQLAQGFDAGRQTFGLRHLQPTQQARQWLQLRLHALSRGRVFDTEQVTPRYLQSIDALVCPITREVLSHDAGEASDWSVCRVFNNAAYAAGNLAVVSVRANAAKGDLGFAALKHVLNGKGLGGLDGLDAAQWGRVAVLASFSERLSHGDAAGLPMLVLPPNRVRVFNPIQALQAVVCRLVLAHAEDSEAVLDVRLMALVSQFPGKTLRQDVVSFLALYRSQIAALCFAQPGLALRSAVEDAWLSRAVLNRWKRAARQLTAIQAELIVESQGQGARMLPDHQATEGWALETLGCLVPRPVPRRLADPKVALPADHWLAAKQGALFAE